MTAQIEPVVSQWYRHLDKGQQFYVTALDEKEGTVEVQHFDGDVEEMDLDDWHALALDPIEPPEDWTGPMDDVERDDLGYSETNVSSEDEDWRKAMQEKDQPAEEE